jgi:epoxyqueuosine reductase
MGFFYPHNIHPYTEMKRRKDTLISYAEQIGLRIICQEGYNLEEFLRNTAFRENSRCYYCYYERLKAAALLAKRGKFDYFTSTLLYSKFQKHDLIRSIGEDVGKTVGVGFYYDDFRKGWKEGIVESRALGMYRQQYCGCIYSEKERFAGKALTQT